MRACVRVSPYADGHTLWELDEEALKSELGMVPFGHSCAPLMCVVTTCDVREGDELLISYGHSYWIRKELKGALSADEGAEMSKKAATPAVVVAATATTAPAVRAQAAVEAEYAAEISRLELVFAAAAREAAGEGTDAQDITDERRMARPQASADTNRTAGGDAAAAPVNRRQRRKAAKKKNKKK